MKGRRTARTGGPDELVSRVDRHEMADLADHAADGRRIQKDRRLVRTAQAETLQGAALGFGAADAALDLSELELDRHG